jgi:prevent-host-death family protein
MQSLDGFYILAIIDLTISVHLIVRSIDMVKKINALKARKNLGQLLEEVYYKGDQYIIERAGRPMAAVVPIWQLEEWQKRRKRFFETVEETWRKNEGVPPETIEQEIAEAVQVVRTKPARRTR